MDVAVVGVGAIGGVMASALAAAGHDVMLCIRTPVDGLIIERPDGARVVKARMALAASDVFPAPWVIVATKAHEVAGAAAWLRALSGPATTVAIVQNGVEHEERVAPYCDGATLVPVVINCRAGKVGPGRIVQRTPAEVVVPASDAGRRFVALLAGSDIHAAASDDFVTAAWRKLCLNVASGPITALTDQPLGIIRRPEVAEVARELIHECVRVGRAEGALLSDDLADELVTAMVGEPADAGTSMLADRRAGKRLEVDARNGAVVRIGARHRIPAPLNWAFTALLVAINQDRDD